MLMSQPSDDSQRLTTFTTLRPRLLRLANRMLRDESEAQDAVQDAWIRLARGERDDPTALRDAQAWLVAVVTRLCIDRLRRRSAEAAWLASETRSNAPLAGHAVPSPLSPLELADDARTALRVLLSRLSAEDCALLLLHDVLDLDHGELSRLLERSEAASRQALHRARRRLREPSRAGSGVTPDELTVARALAAIRDASSRALLAALGLRQAAAASQASQPPAQSMCRLGIVWRAGGLSLVVRLDSGASKALELAAIPLPLLTQQATVPQ